MARKGTAGQPAPKGELATYAPAPFTDNNVTHTVYRKGTGPAVLVLSEMPGITPMVLGFADRVTDQGCTAVVPDLFGRAGRDPTTMGLVARHAYILQSLMQVCVSREFTLFATGRSSKVVDWLRALARHEHERCGGPGVGVVGMCLTGGFALAMAADPAVIAPVMSQPALPLPAAGRRARTTDIAPDERDVVVARCASGELSVVGLRFHDDWKVPAQRFDHLAQLLGDAFCAVELSQDAGNTAEQAPTHHSMLTGGLVDEPGQDTRDALDRVLSFLNRRLVGP